MTKWFLYLFIICGFATLIPGSTDKLVYYYFRITNGSTFTVDEQCFLVPEKWVIIPLETRISPPSITLHKKIDGHSFFVSIRPATKNSISTIEDSVPIKIYSDQFRLYDVSKFSAKDSAQYLSYISGKNLIIMADDIDALETLSVDIDLCKQIGGQGS